jgi:hypothetical protein
MKTKISIAILATLILTLVMGAVTVFAQEPTTFFISVYHFLKGDEIDLSREAPVMIAVVKDGLTIDYLRMEYRQRVEADLPGGEYEFIFHDADTFDTLFTCGPYEFENGDDVRMQAHEQGPGRIPDCYVKFK